MNLGSAMSLRPAQPGAAALRAGHAPPARPMPLTIRMDAFNKVAAPAVGASRRSLLMGAGFSLLLGAPPSVNAEIERPYRERWDGYSSGEGSCPLGPEGAECRLGLITQDRAKDTNQTKTYMDSGSNSRTSTVSKAVPLGNMEGYGTTTTELLDLVDAYLAMEPFDRNRPTLSTEIKDRANKWVGQYAPGGSTRVQSARLTYTGLNALLGHLSFSGGSPPSAQGVIQKNCGEARALIALGK